MPTPSFEIPRQLVRAAWQCGQTISDGRWRAARQSRASVAHLATLRPANVAVEGVPSLRCARRLRFLGSGSGSHHGAIDDVGDQNSPLSAMSKTRIILAIG